MVMKADTQIATPTIPAGEFKARCLKLMDEAVVKRQRFAITKRGKLIGHFEPVPPEGRSFRSIFGRTPGIRIPGQTEWKKLKKEWAGEWKGSSEKLVHNIGKQKSSKP
jgi:hypothetical protein